MEQLKAQQREALHDLTLFIQVDDKYNQSRRWNAQLLMMIERRKLLRPSSSLLLLSLPTFQPDTHTHTRENKQRTPK